MNGRQATRPIPRIVDATDFERVLKAPSAARTPHFAIHHVATHPGARQGKLSTATTGGPVSAVDDLRPYGVWLGYVVPKRHARRAVTRSLLKRQIREAVQRRLPLAGGLWVVRLRSGFDKAVYPSAASKALAGAARVELDGLLEHAVRRVEPKVPAGSDTPKAPQRDLAR